MRGQRLLRKFPGVWRLTRLARRWYHARRDAYPDWRQILQAVRLQRRFDVATDVRPLTCLLGVLDDESLHDGRVDRAGHHNDDAPETDGDHREPPSLLAYVDDQQHGGEYGDQRE